MEEPRSLLRETYFAAVDASSPRATLPTHVERIGERILIYAESRTIDLTPLPGGRLCIISTGKGAEGMYREAVRITAPPDTGIVVGPGKNPHLPGAFWIEGNHPLPGKNSLAAGQTILDTLSSLKEGDSLLYLLSGGSSSMVSLPIQGLSLSDKREITVKLMNAGASIYELNCIRKALSRVKGGKLAPICKAVKSCVLVMSDVPGNNLSTIGSGPFLSSSFEGDPIKILEKYSLWGEIPARMRLILKEASPALPRNPIPHVLIADNQSALNGAGVFLLSKGFHLHFHEKEYEGDAITIGGSMGERAMSLLGKTKGCRSAFLAGGETSVKVKGGGRGGRNQEMAIGAALAVQGSGLTGLCAGSDGIDGSSCAAGGYFDGELIERAWSASLDPATYLNDNDSFTFLHSMGYSFITGETGINVMDLCLCISM